MGLGRKRILLLGYSGKANFGDDLLLKQAVDALAPHKDFSLTIHTSETTSASDYLGRWFPEAEITKGAISFSLVRRHTHVLYFGGGVFFEYRKVPALLFLRRLLSMVLLFSIPRYLLGIRFIGIGLGLGPFHSRAGYRLTAFRLWHFSYLSLRDQDSLDMARQMGCSNLNICPDLSMLECSPSYGNSSAASAIREGVLICARHYPHGEKGNRYLHALKEAIFMFREAHPGMSFTIFGFQKNHDEEAVALLDADGISTQIWDPFQSMPEDVLRLFASKQLIVSSRMHGIFMAGIAGVPSLAIGVHPKLQYASGFFANSRSVEENTGATALYAAMEEAFMAGHLAAAADLAEAGKRCAEEYRKLVQIISEGE